MNLPKRWLEDRSESTALERAILRPALTIAIPSGEEQRIWTKLMAGAPLAAVALTASSAAGSSAATAAAEGSVTAASAIGGGAKLGVAVIGKAFAIGVASGALFAGGVSAVAPRADRQEAAPAPVAQARPAERPRPERASSMLPVSPLPPDQAEPGGSEPPASPHSSARESLPVAHGESRPPEGSRPAAPSVTSFPSLSSPPAQAPRSSLREEAAVLRRAREALRQGNLSVAFAELEVARTAFPRGALGEEREALTIELLSRRGQRDAASRRAQAFLRSFPKSAYAANVRKFVF